jgi:hypothetical protein
VSATWVHIETLRMPRRMVMLSIPDYALYEANYRANLFDAWAGAVQVGGRGTALFEDVVRGLVRRFAPDDFPHPESLTLGWVEYRPEHAAVRVGLLHPEFEVVKDGEEPPVVQGRAKAER